MIREKLIEQGIGEEFGFRWRGHDVSRIEGLSDGVFGFAVTLLVVSLEVPKTFGDLMVIMRGFPAFAISFAMLILVWYQQYIFFRRYGMKDTLTIVLNAFLLFVILFYVYPLKFVWTLLTNLALGFDIRVRLADGQLVYPLEREQAAPMMIIFGLGYTAVFLVFTLLYSRAYRKRDELKLNSLEVYDTRVEVESLLINVGIGLLSVSFPALGGSRYAAIAGWCYMLVGPLLAIHGVLRGRRRKKMQESFSEKATAA